jgi:hypothetical protein
MFENKELRRIFEPKGEGVVEGWRQLHNGDGTSSFVFVTKYH